MGQLHGRGAQERPTPSRRCLSLTLCSKSSVCKKLRWLQTRPCSLQREKSQELWPAREWSFVHRITLAQKTCLPALAPNTIRRAAREFSMHTAASTDCFAMRHLPCSAMMPSREVVAGCAIATCLVKLCCLCWTMLFGCILGCCSMFFIGDSHQSAQGTPREARQLVVAARRTFTKEAQKHSRVRFAEKKTAIVSSHRKVALIVAHHLGLQAEAVTTRTVGLGVDVTACKARAATTARRRKRLPAACKRKARLQPPETSRPCSPENLCKRPCTVMKSQVFLWRVEESATSGSGGSQPADSRQVPLCALAMVRGPDGVLAHCVYWRGKIGEHGQFLKVLSLPAMRKHGNEGSCSGQSPVGATFLGLDRLVRTWPPPFQFFGDKNTEILLTTTSRVQPCAEQIRGRQQEKWRSHQASRGLGDPFRWPGAQGSVVALQRSCHCGRSAG